jgi:hypothetical protein
MIITVSEIYCETVRENNSCMKVCKLSCCELPPRSLQSRKWRQLCRMQSVSCGFVKQNM